jgi:carbon monoxide dehydrogenase subunit G
MGHCPVKRKSKLERVKVERTISIARPPSDVFGYISDVRNDPAWHTDVLDVSSSTDHVGVGTVFNVRVKPSMGVSEGTMTVSRLEPGKLVEFQGHMGKMAPTVTNICEPDGPGTRVTRRVELEPPGVMRVMSPMIKRMIGKSNDGFLASLKKLLESSGG